MVDISANQNKSSTLSQFLKVFEPAYTIVSLFLFSRGIIALILTNGASQGDGHVSGADDFALASVFLSTVYMSTFVLLILRWRKVLTVLIKDKYISLYLGIFLLSYFWSDFPQDTFRVSLPGIGSVAFGLYFATRYTLKEQVKLLFWTFALMLITSIFLAVAIPKYAFMAGVHEGAFRGIFTHKNQFGPTMIIGLLIFLIKTLDKNRNNNWLLWFFVFSSIFLIVLSKSGNAMIMLAMMLPLFFITSILRAKYEVMISVFLTVAIVGLMGITWFNSNQEVFFAAIGEDPSLTGRTDIWKYVWDMIQQRPWLGYGYEGFWHNLEGASAYVNFSFGPFGPQGVPHSHNGFLEILLATGFVGLSVFLIGFAINFVKAIALIRTYRDMEALWPLLYLTYAIVANLAEIPVASFNNLFWVLYSATIFSLSTPPSQSLTDKNPSSSY